MQPLALASAARTAFAVAIVSGLLAFGCGGGSALPPGGSPGAAGTTTGAAGSGAAGTTTGTAGNGAAGTTTGAAGSGAAGTTTGAAGSGAAGTTTGAAGSGAAGTTTGTAGNGAAGTTTGAAGATCAAGTGAAGTGAAGTGATSDITKVVPAGVGCGKDAPVALLPGMLVRQTIMTMGVKDAMCADSRCGCWVDTREYYVRLPMGYDPNTPYPLVFEGPGCGAHGNNLFALAAFNDTVIRVGLSPSATWQAFHATNPGQGCFDDKEGDDSVDFVFYETLWDQLAATLCFDKNRVFASGNSSGAWLANELGCKYAGDAKRPVRAVMVNTGGLPTDPRFVPTCTNNPMAGFWSHDVADSTNPFAGDIVAMNRALMVNGCTPPGVTYETATFQSFPIGGGNADTVCRRYMGCPDLFPLVVCPTPGNTQASHDNVVNPGWPAFLSLFAPK